MNHLLPILVLGFLLDGCFQLPSTGSIGNVTRVAKVGAQEVSLTKSIATIAPSETETVKLAVSETSNIGGTSISVAPGALAVATNIVIEQGADFADSAINSEVGLTDDIEITSAANGVIVRPSEPAELKKPLQLSLPLPTMALHLAADTHYAVYYKVFDPAQNRLVTGMKTVDGVNLKVALDEATNKDTLQLEGFFGIYWAVTVSREVKKEEIPVEKTSEQPIVNKANTQVIAAAGIIKEADIVKVQSVPEISWKKPALVFDAATRSVSLTADTIAVSQCKVDFFEKATDTKGQQIENAATKATIFQPMKLAAHNLIGRFRCVDDQTRTTISPWSDAVEIPAYVYASVQSVDASQDNGIYAAGSTLTFAVTFPAAVTVTGAPSLKLNVGSATYSAGSGTSSLTFAYKVLAGDETSKLSYDPKTALAIDDKNTIVDKRGLAVVPALPELTSDKSFVSKKTLVIDSTAPTAPTSAGFASAASATTSLSLSWAASSDANMKQYKAKICTQNDCKTGCSAEQTVTAAAATISGTDGGAYYACVQAEDIVGNVTAWVPSIQTTTINTVAPTVNVGAARTVNATFTVDAVTTGATTFAWSKQSGPGTITFGAQTAEDTSITASVSGTYVLRLTAFNSAGVSANADLTVTWDTSVPTVNAGADIVSNAAATLSPTVSGAVSYAWTVTSGGSGTFSSPTTAATTFTASSDAAYVLRLTVTNAAGTTAFDELTYTRDTVAPVVNAGADFYANAAKATVATVTGSAVSYQWTKFSGTGTVTFSTATSLNTNVTASAEGAFTLRLTATDAAGNSAFDDVSLTWDITPPVVNAGADKYVNVSTAVTGTVTGASTIAWTKQSGSGTITFTSATSAATNISANASDSYTLRLTGTDQAGNSAYDEIIFKWDTTAPTFGGIREVYSPVMTTSAHIFWNAATDNLAASSEIVYDICWSTVSTFCSSTFTTNASVPANIWDYKVTGLTSGTPYYFVVRAKDPLGNVDTNTVVKSSGQQPTVTSLKLGTSHSCGILNGVMKCWGANFFGQLGDGTAIDRFSPVTANVSGTVTAVAVGENFSCALISTGSVKCWGRNSFGQLGNGTNTNSTSPVTVSGITTATAIAADDSAACAVLSSGSIQCWGYGGDGGLGNGQNGNSNVPVTVSGITTATDVSVGHSYACAKLTSGVSCWGKNHVNQLGGASTANSNVPVAVSGISSVTQLVSGEGHSCVLASGTVKCWGANSVGQIDGSGSSKTSPYTVTAFASASAIGVGYGHTCAVVSGTVKCQGINLDGQLGNGSFLNSNSPVNSTGSTSDVAVGGNRTCAILSTGYSQCWGQNRWGELGIGVSSVGAGVVSRSDLSGITLLKQSVLHSCAIISGTGIKCWGMNWLYEASSTSGQTVTPALVPSTSGATDIHAGGGGFSCSLVSGAVKCWGGGGGGQLGTGSYGDSSSPTPVTGLSSGVVSLAGGYGFACAHITGGTVKCWGNNNWGQLGNGTSGGDSNVPVTVSISGVSGIYGRDDGMCALLTDASLKCWGRDDFGQAGQGSAGNIRSTPVTVLTNVSSQIWMGGQHNIVKLLDGTWKGWGANGNCQLTSSCTNILSPTTLTMPSNTSSLALSEVTTCVLLSDGGVMCRGANWSGQAGQPNNSFSSGQVPNVSAFTAIEGLSDVSSIYGGGHRTCAVVSDSSLRCWGEGRGSLFGPNKAHAATPHYLLK